MDRLKSSLKFIDYIVQKIEFYNNPKCSGNKFDIDFDIDSKVNFNTEDTGFSNILRVFLFKDPEKNNYPFSMEIEIKGLFQIDNVDEATKQIFAEKNSVAILFPYVRALVSSYTSLSNVPPVILPPINVIKYLENKKLENIKEKK